MTEESLYKQKTRKLAGLRDERKNWEGHWKELAQFFSPRRSRWLEDSTTQRGQKHNQKLIDPTPRFAVRTLSSGMHAGSTNPSMPWFKLTTPDPEMLEYPAVAQWLYTVEMRMRDVFERSNLYSVLPMVYADAGLYGTAPLLALDHPTRIVHFVPSALGSYYLATSADGAVETKYREYKMTATQIVAEFGKDRCSDQVKASVENGTGQTWHDILHVIEPNGKRQYGNIDASGMAYSSCYFELNSNHEQSLGERGFEDNPIAAFRWETTEITDAYGSSPGMDALGASKAMQVQQIKKAKAIDKHVDPPMVADPEMQNKPSTLLPGGVTYSGFTASGSAPKFQPAYTIKPELAGIMADIQDVRALVHQAMYTDLFLAITMADPRNATVPEIVERREEKILMLGPVLQNHRDGLVKPIIDRTFYLMMRAGMLPPPPRELENVDLKIELTGLLAQALKAVQTSGIERFTGFIGAMAKLQADAGLTPDILDKIDIDQSVDELGISIGVPPTIIRSDDDVAKIRADRAKQQQAQQAAAAAQPIKDAAQAAKALSETQVGGQSALDAMVDA